MNQSLNIYGDLPEEDAILRKLLEMNLSPDSWRDSWNGDGYTPIEENYGLIVKMGRRLDYLGGSHFMRSILEDTYKRDWGRLDHAWSGIGNWLAKKRLIVRSKSDRTPAITHLRSPLQNYALPFNVDNALLPLGDREANDQCQKSPTCSQGRARQRRSGASLT